MSSPAPGGDDTQRELEQRALRNVRGLVDKMESYEAHDTRTQKRYLIGIVVGGLVVMLLLALGLWHLSSRRGEGHTIEAIPGKPSASAPASR